MQHISQDKQSTGVHVAERDDAELRRMIGPDKHRPGPARYRLRAENIPVRAVIGQLRAITGTSDLTSVSEEAIAEVGFSYDISRQAVLAALLYYREHTCAIDALLEENAAYFG